MPESSPGLVCSGPLAVPPLSAKRRGLPQGFGAVPRSQPGSGESLMSVAEFPASLGCFRCSLGTGRVVEEQFRFYRNKEKLSSGKVSDSYRGSS